MTVLLILSTWSKFVVDTSCLLFSRFDLLPEQGERSVWNSDRSPLSSVRLASWS